MEQMTIFLSSSSYLIKLFFLFFSFPLSKKQAHTVSLSLSFSLYNVPTDQCGQIGRFFKVFGAKFFTKVFQIYRLTFYATLKNFPFKKTAVATF